MDGKLGFLKSKDLPLYSCCFRAEWLGKGGTSELSTLLCDMRGEANGKRKDAHNQMDVDHLSNWVKGE